jgi:hypothetical protein
MRPELTANEPHPLSGFGKFDPKERLAKDEWLHEEAVVKALLGVYRQGSDVKFEILRQSKEKVGKPRLTLMGLRNVTGISEKFMIEAAVVPGIMKNCTIDKLLRRFETREISQKFFEHYDEHLNSDYSGMEFAMVIKCPFVQVGLVMHTAMDTVFMKGYRFVVEGKSFNVTMETFDQFAKTELRGAGR